MDIYYTKTLKQAEIINRFIYYSKPEFTICRIMNFENGVSRSSVFIALLLIIIKKKNVSETVHTVVLSVNFSPNFK